MHTFSTLLADRDGTLIYDRHYLSDPNGVELLPYAGEALAAFQRNFINIYVISNQSGIGRGMFTREAADACNLRMKEKFKQLGVSITDIFYCPHTPAENCSCRKPGTGMWSTLQATHHRNPSTTCMIGDKSEDLAFASNAGLAASILVLTGKGSSTAEKLGVPQPDDGFHTFPSEQRHGYPQAVISSFRWFGTAVTELQAALYYHE